MKRNGLSISLLYTDIIPSMEMTLSLWSGLSTKKFQPECVNEKKVLESFKSCLLLLVAPSGLIDTLAQLLAWRSLLWFSMRWRWKYLTQSNFLSTTSLVWYLALHSLFCFSQEKPIRWKELNTHTQSPNLSQHHLRA